ncbi:MAG: UvrD-helicase domain-containing protein, partial [Pigmentiphaga sp.]
MTESRSLACQIPLWGSRLIEASAGTGKTFTISALYLRLVLGHGDDLGFARALTPPEILVMTFTEAATFELKGRIRERLTEGARFFREEAGAHGDDFLKELRADYPEEQWPRCARVLEQAALWMDDAAISTIHSWCYRMLREHAFQSGSVFNPTLVTDQGSVIDELFKDYWRQQAYPLSAALAQWMAAEFASPAGLAGASKLNGGLEAEPDAALHEVLDQALARYE